MTINKMDIGGTLSETELFFEKKSDTTLTPRIPVVGRIDGKNFSKFTKSLKKSANSPWNLDFVESMIMAGIAVANNMQGCKVIYVQSDEITFVLTDFRGARTQPWLGYRTRKMNSLAASIGSIAFYKDLSMRIPEVASRTPVFDSRFWNRPNDVENAVVYRQMDAIRNSVQMYARHFFSHKQCLGKSVKEMREVLTKNGTPWEDLPTNLKMGTLIYKIEEEVELDLPQEVIAKMKTKPPETVMRKRWNIDREVPLLIKNSDWLRDIILNDFE